jgi:TRAP-type C4-dicarboxylate transport system substrate-binding protein
MNKFKSGYLKYVSLMIVTFLCVIFSYGKMCHAEKKYKIKFATVAPEGSIWVNYMKDLDNRLNTKSKGRLRLLIYAGGIAGDELDVLKKIRIGQLHCAAFSGVGITEILPEWRVMDLPFFFRNIDEVKAVHKDLQNLFTDEFKKKGFEYISWAEVGDVYLFSKREILKRDDLKGLKIWTWSGDPVSKRTFTIMGSTPISLAITDVTTAINTNMIDTVYAPPVGALAMQWNENMNYMTGFPIAHSTGAILISKGYFDQIPEDLAELFKEEVKLSMDKLTDELQIQTADAIKVIKDKGIIISPAPEGEELQKFYELHDEVANALKGDIYPEELLTKVNNVLKKIRTR